MAIFIARELLAEQIRDKITKDLEGTDLEWEEGEDAETFAAYVSGDNVVEILEELVEGGDAVIDDAATHQWFRNKLAEQRDLEARIDRFGSATGTSSTD